ncbi:MAG: ROK family protein [Clostridia bacterium]
MKYYLGIDLGGTNIAFGVADENKNLFVKHSIKTNAKRPYEEIIEDMAKTSIEFLQNNDISLENLESIGIGVPGIIDAKTKKIVMAANLGWYDVDVVSDMKKFIDTEIYIANDADAATFGELMVADNLSSMAMLTLGTGVGGGVIYDGKIFGGGDGIGFELGHLTLVPNGILCNCGNKGCVETYVSTSALIRFARENVDDKSAMHVKCEGDYDKLDGKIIFECAQKGDEKALKTLEIYGEYLAIACYNTIMTYRPDALMLGGGISVQEELLINPVRAKVAKMLEPMGSVKNTPIIRATLGNDAGILGACFLKFSGELA